MNPETPKQSTPFVAIVSLVSFALLIALGVSAVGPREQKTDDENTTPALTPLESPTVTFVNPRYGAEQPKVTIVAFGDYGCEPCRTVENSLREVQKKYPHDVSIVWKDLPNPTAHAGAGDAAIAGRCAANQGAFWEFNRGLFAMNGVFSVENFTQLAGVLKLNTDEFATCITNTETRPLVERDIEEAVRLGIDATPYMFIGSRRVSGAVDTATIDAFVQEALNGK